MEASKIKICPICQMQFECDHSVDCWCSNIQIPKEIQTYLNSKFNDCLCKECLTKTILKQEKNNPGTIIVL